MRALSGYLLVFLGAGIGGTLRHAVNRVALTFSSGFPWGTFAINVTGSLCMGLIAGWFGFRGSSGQPLRLFLTTGLLGGFTTFSAFSLETALLWERGRVRDMLGYAGGSVVASVAALFIGIAIMRT